MNSKRTFFLLLAVSALLICAILGAAYASKSILTSKSQELVSLKAKLQGYKAQEVGLVQAKKDIATYNSLFSIAKTVVPENKNQAQTVRQIVKLANDNSIVLGSVSFPSSTLGAGTAGSAAAPNKPTLGSPVAPKSLNLGSSADLSQLSAVSGSPGVYVLQINVASDANQPANFSQLINFLSSLENNRLTAEVTTVNIVPDSTSPNRFSFSLSLNSYIKP